MKNAGAMVSAIPRMPKKGRVGQVGGVVDGFIAAGETATAAAKHNTTPKPHAAVPISAMCHRLGR